ncbi:hypothetical protein [uncultured Desulfobulbus sp.]|uniref:hypothetical protein n=1 Tax=uncultured Desulfobulbus sp. TaxID=239745 RepID=UPI0029C6DF34|nr:hypothetical protein [uncultured Desulfobulbus sp.]
MSDQITVTLTKEQATAINEFRRKTVLEVEDKLAFLADVYKELPEGFTLSGPGQAGLGFILSGMSVEVCQAEEILWPIFNQLPGGKWQPASNI